MSKFYAELRVLLIQRNISIKKLSEKTGIEYPNLLRRFQGLHKFTEEDIFKICDYLEIEPCQYFFGGLMQKLHEKQIVNQ